MPWDTASGHDMPWDAVSGHANETTSCPERANNHIHRETPLTRRLLPPPCQRNPRRCPTGARHLDVPQLAEPGSFLS